MKITGCYSKVDKVPSVSTLVDPTSLNWARPVLTNEKLVVEVFDGTGHFGMWKSEVLDALFQQGLDIAVEESKPEDVEEMNWLTINRLACGMIRSCLSREQQYAFSKETSAYKLWVALEEKFLKTSCQNKLFMKKQLFLFTYIPGSSINIVRIASRTQKEGQAVSSSGDAEVLLVRGRSQRRAPTRDGDPRKAVAEANATKCDDEESNLSLATSSSKNASEIWLLDSAYETPLTTYGIGSVRLQNEDGTIVTLKGVRYSPKLKKNLISVGTLESKGFEVRAKDGVMKIISGVLVVMKGIRKINNTYHYKGRMIIGTIEAVTDGDRNSEANGVAERMNRTLLEKVWCMLSNAGLGKEFWVEAVTYACHLVNRLPSTAIDGKTPCEKWYGKPATDYDSLHLDGTLKKVEFKRIIVLADIKPDDNSPMVEGDYEEKEVQAEEPRQQQHESIATSKPKRNTKRHARFNDMVACASSIAADDVSTTYSKAVRDLENEKLHFYMVTWKRKSIWFSQKDSKLLEKSMKILLALVAQLDLELFLMDVKTAFLHGDLEKEIYMVQPEGFKVAGKEHEVYDMLIASQSLDEIEKLKTRLKREFEMKDLDEAKMILDMEIDRDRKLRKLCLTQKQYLRRVLKRFWFSKQTKRAPYANAVGSLMYAMICTRPDISHVVGMSVGGRILRFNYAGDLDKRRSTTGYVFTMAKAPAVKEAIWLQGLLDELGINQKFVTVYSDSQSAIHLVKNQVYHARTNHIDVRYHFIREILEEGGVRIQKTPPKMVDSEIEEWIFAKVEIFGGILSLLFHNKDKRSFSMYMFLPSEKEGIPSLIEKLGSESSFLERHIPREQVKVGRFFIPKFDISFGFDASNMLKELGLVLPFTHGCITEMVDQGLTASSMHHKVIL
nr:retrovirus-related Pol polyprotein from transposon TNT 1-94 [Tanacetum cinerariifolium]